MSPEKLKIEGLKALRDKLGAVGMAMFLRQFDLGEGDYTKERNCSKNMMTLTKSWKR